MHLIGCLSILTKQSEQTICSDNGDHRIRYKELEGQHTWSKLILV
jgi:hypothetical protein